MPDSFALVEEASEALAAAVRDLRPDDLEPDDAARLVSTFTRLTKLGESGRTLVAPYVERSSLWRKAGHTSPEAWLAAEAGIPYGEARAVLETGRRLVQSPEVDDAVRDGGLSFDQMKEVAEGAEADPDAAKRLLDAAHTKTLKQLRDEKRRVKAAADDDQYGVYERQRRARRGSHGTKPDGMAWIYAEFTPDVGAAVVSHLEAESRRFAPASVSNWPRLAEVRYSRIRLRVPHGVPVGQREYLTSSCPRSAVRAGPNTHTSSLGQGPIPVEVCREIMGDAFLRGVLVDGTEVTRVHSFGRHITAEQRAALTVDAFLQHGDLVCSVDGCDRPDVEWDHLHEHAARGPTATWNLHPLCRGHHKEKTAGRLALADGRWRAVRPAPVPAPALAGRAPP